MILSLSCAPSFAAEQTPYGVWLRDDGNAVVRIAPCGSNICATNLQIKDTSKGEQVGDRLVMSLNQVSSNEWTGTAYDPKREKAYRIAVIVKPNGLTTRGCILGGLLCRSVNWTPTSGG
jgi:uncharacterized protein (DUF2147 family)